MQSLIHSVYFSNDILKTSTHHHDCHQIIFILKGEAEICVNGQKYTAHSGNAVIFSRYENHSVNILSKEYERFVLRIRPWDHSNYNKIYSLLSNRPTGFKNIINIRENTKEFEGVFNLIIKEYNLNLSLCDEMLEALVNRLLIMLYRQISQNNDYFEEQSFDIILNLQKELEENYSLSYSLEDLSKKYNLSISTLSHQFKKITGMSVMGYLLSCRIASAKNYLAKTNLSISEIVDQCGFSDNSNFSRTFKKLNGISPSEFRKNNN